MSTKRKIIFLQLAGPSELSVSAIRKFLKSFLWSRRLVKLPRLFWGIILFGMILPFRPKNKLSSYKKIWDGKEFLLSKLSRQFSEAVGSKLPNAEVHYVELGQENEVFKKLLDSPTLLEEQWSLIPLYPFQTESTHGYLWDEVSKEFERRVKLPAFEFLPNFLFENGYNEASKEYLQKFLDENSVDQLFISFHGLPVKRITKDGDPYLEYCKKSFEYLKEKLNFSGEMMMTFQSRFRSERKWLSPFTDEETLKACKKGQTVAIYCMSFPFDCLETQVEIGVDLQILCDTLPGKLLWIPCLNLNPKFISRVSDQLRL